MPSFMPYSNGQNEDIPINQAIGLEINISKPWVGTIGYSWRGQRE
jgi:hypothetical protein